MKYSTAIHNDVHVYTSHTCTCLGSSVGRVLCLEFRVSWVRVPTKAAHFPFWKSDYLGCVVLLYFVVCMQALLASFFLPYNIIINYLFPVPSLHAMSSVAKESKESSSICSCCSTKESFDLGPETHKRRFLNLRNQWNQNLRRKTHNKSMSSKRESELIETLNRSDPNFGSAEPTNRHFKTLKQIPSDPEKRQTNMSSSQATGNSQKIPVKARKTSSSLDAGDSPEMSAKGIKTSSSLDAGDSPQMPSRERHTVN